MRPHRSPSGHPDGGGLLTTGVSRSHPASHPYVPKPGRGKQRPRRTDPCLLWPGKDTPSMVRGSDLTATNGTYTLTAQPGRVYTVTTTTGQAPGTATSPQRSQLALPYSTFAGYGAGREANTSPP